MTERVEFPGTAADFILLSNSEAGRRFLEHAAGREVMCADGAIMVPSSHGGHGYNHLIGSGRAGLPKILGVDMAHEGTESESVEAPRPVGWDANGSPVEGE